MFRLRKGNEMSHVVRVNAAVIDKLSEPAGKIVRIISDSPIFRTDFHDFIMILGQINPQDLVVGMADGLYVRGHSNDKCRNFFVPHSSDGGDIDHLSKGVVVAERLIFLLVTDGQDGAVGTGMISQFMAWEARADMGRDLTYTFIKI